MQQKCAVESDARALCSASQRSSGSTLFSALSSSSLVSVGRPWTFSCSTLTVSLNAVSYDQMSMAWRRPNHEIGFTHLDAVQSVLRNFDRHSFIVSEEYVTWTL